VTVPFRGAFIPKLAKMTVTHDTRAICTTRCTFGPCCSINSQRWRSRLRLMSIPWSWSDFWPASTGLRARIASRALQ
jgi:hypothetical protein